MKNELATIILAAGKGTRMNSEMPKVLHEVGGKPMLIHVIEKSKIIGSKKIISVLGYKYEMVKNAISKQDIDFTTHVFPPSVPKEINNSTHWKAPFDPKDEFHKVVDGIPIIKI